VPGFFDDGFLWALMFYYLGCAGDGLRRVPVKKAEVDGKSKD